MGNITRSLTWQLFGYKQTAKRIANIRLTYTLIVSHIFLYILFPVLLRAAAFHSGEYLGIVVGVCEAGFLGDFHDAVIGAEEKFKAPLHTVFLQKCKQGYIHVSLE